MRIARFCSAFQLALGLAAAAGAGVLPKLAVPIEADADAATAAKAVGDCQPKGKLVVLPPVRFSVSEAPGQAGDLRKLVDALPAETEAALHVQLRPGKLSETDKAREKIVSDRAAALIGALPLAAVPVRALIVELEEPADADELLQFTLMSIAVKAKGANAGLQAVFFFPAGFIGRHPEFVKRVAIYADALGLPNSRDWRKEAAWIAEQALNKPVYLRVAEAPEGLEAAYMDALMVSAGSAVEVLWPQAPGAQTVARLCAATNLLAKFVKSDFTVAEPGAEAFSITVQPSEGAAHKLFADGRSPDVALLARISATREKPRDVTVAGAAVGQVEIQWYDPLSAAPLKPGELKKADKRVSQSAAVDSEYALIWIHSAAAGEERAYAAVEVTARADLKVEEILARWQQYREGQRQVLDNYTAAAFLNLHFEATGMGSGFDIGMSMEQFVDRSGLIEWVQKEFFVNGVKFSKKREFPLPQLEPEKVVTQPLELKLNEKYDYRILGTDQVDGVFCYVVGVEPKESGESLYSGKVWIDGTSFRQVRMELRQRGMKSNVVNNVETQNYGLVPDGRGHEFNLVKSIYAQQTLNAAGRNFVLEKTYRFSDYAINTAEFQGRLKAARDSDNTMYRDTEAGLRALRKQGQERVVEEAGQKRVRSILAGAMYEGTFNFPIPLFGLSLVDFNFRKTDTQLSVFFAGPILAANLSKQWRSRYRVGLDLALSALPGDNRMYSGNTELKTQELWAFEETTGTRFTWQATTSLSLTGTAYLSYERFRATSDTDKLYRLPRNGLTVYPGVELKYARKGYVFNASGTRGSRLGWREFGYGSEPVNPDFTKYSAEFNKQIYLGRFTKGGISTSYYGGDRLDRFSRYRPSFLSRPRIRGIPSGTDSFDAVGLASVNYGFNVMELVKFEGYYNYARARNKVESRRFREFDGLEFDFGTAGPWGTFLQGTITYALRGNLERYNSRFGVYFLIFKPLK